MKIINPSHEIIQSNSPYKHIERIGRICYRSEDAITDTSAEPFCVRMFNSNHHAMLEHFRFIVVVGGADYTYLIENTHNKYITFTHDNGRYMVSASARGLHDMYRANMDDLNGNLAIDEVNAIMDTCSTIRDIIHLIVREYGCPGLFDKSILETYDGDEHFPYLRVIKNFSELSDTEYYRHAWYSIHFVCDRGVSHEMVRHRDASFAQESTRYCNYNRGKFGGELTVIKPLFWDEDSEAYRLWYNACAISEGTYNDLIKLGAKPQEARSVLPNSLKTEIVITAQVYEWRHIFNLRVLGTTGAPHPQIKEVMKPAYEEMIEKGYIKWTE